MAQNAAITTAQFLGTGWTFPPSFDRRAGSVVMSSDVVNIRQCLWVLFSTSLGERIMLATYGTAMRRKVFDALTETLKNDFRALIAKAILDWEPRIDVLQITVAADAAATDFSVRYQVQDGTGEAERAVWGT